MALTVCTATSLISETHCSLHYPLVCKEKPKLPPEHIDNTDVLPLPEILQIIQWLNLG